MAPGQRPTGEGAANHTDPGQHGNGPVAGGGPDQLVRPTPSSARRKRTADKLARAEQAHVMLIARHGDTRGALTAPSRPGGGRRCAERLAHASAEHQAKLERHHAGQRAKADGGHGAPGRPPKPMDLARTVLTACAEHERARAALVRALADPNKSNTTDPHCRIMPAKTGGYICAYNLQALANTGQIILAITLHDNCVDVAALHPLLRAGRANLDAAGISEPIGTALFDAGYASEDNFTTPAKATYSWPSDRPPGCWRPVAELWAQIAGTVKQAGAVARFRDLMFEHQRGGGGVYAWAAGAADAYMDVAVCGGLTSEPTQAVMRA